MEDSVKFVDSPEEDCPVKILFCELGEGDFKLAGSISEDVVFCTGSLEDDFSVMVLLCELTDEGGFKLGEELMGVCKGE